MEPSYKNGIMVAPLDDGESIVGFYIEGGNDGVLSDYIDEHFRQEVKDLTYDQAVERLDPVKTYVESKGYNTGPFEVKTHKEWCVEVLGDDPDDYDRHCQEELDEQSSCSFDEE